MRPLMTRSPPADGGYPLDSDLYQMTDGGGVLAPDPARLADRDWRDNLGEWDTFAADGPGTPGAGTVTIRRGPVDPGDQPGEPLRGPLWASIQDVGGVAGIFNQA